MRPRSSTSPRHHQRGAIMVLFVVAMVAMLGVVGLVLDGSHGMLSKSRLQNLVDAAALSSAKTLDLSDGDETLALAEALDMFGDNAAESGHQRIAELYNGGGLNVAVEFSSTLDPFTPGSTPAQYVRVIATGLDNPTWLARVVGINEISVAASAVAGPSPTLGQFCNVAPMMVCGSDADPTDPYYGYTPGDVTVLKTSAGGGDFEVGPGNFQLVRLDGDTGAADLRRSLAGGFEGCVSPSDDDIETEPGNTIGPVAQGLNTRLGIYQGPLASAQDIYPPDKVIAQLDQLTYVDGVPYYDGVANPTSVDLPYNRTYSYYIDNVLDRNAWAGGEYDDGGVEYRRVLRLPVGRCDGTTNGAGTVPMLGVLCFYLLKEVSMNGSEAEVYGQFMGDDATCPVTGKPGPDPQVGPGPYTIQLYKDPDGSSA